MNNIYLKKSLFTIIMVVIFIGIGIQPAFAVNNSVNPIIILEEIYENYNCIVIGKANHTQRGRNPSLNFYRVIGFGLVIFNDDIYKPAKGWIYTKGEKGEWLYKGKFWGRLRPMVGFPPQIDTKVGIENFHGICLGGITARNPFPTHFIGWAHRVKISNIYH